MSQGLVENARELGFPGGGDSGAQYFDTSEEKMRNIRRQLDAKNDREKLDGLKRLIANVVAQNIEVRKLVYIYLLRYAEQEPDLALLSINSFQKDLSDKNQIIRAMALRVMSGIRVPVISPIVLLGIKKCITDGSPYVRKTAAHAIPKCYSLDDSQKDALIEIIATLLKDRSTITIGSTIMAFNEVCPTRFDLIHPSFRKLCGVLADCDEWGQMAILGLMLRYGRSQFLNPNPNGEDQKRMTSKPTTTVQSKSFYSSDDSSDSDQDDIIANHVELDPDHELLLKSCLPLLQSRNTGVVLAVARVFYHLAPAVQADKIVKPLVRILRNFREMEYVVLSNIATMTLKRPYLFEPFLQQFFVQSTEPVFIRDLKLTIMANIATDSNIHVLLNELQQYVKSSNKDFVAASIQAIARCATSVPSSSDRCLRLLMKLLRSSNEIVVAESVVMVTKLLKDQPAEHKKSILALAKLLDTIKVPSARANILWLIGQHAQLLPEAGPDVLRQAVKGFAHENVYTKLQIINLSSKLVILNPDHPTLSLLHQYTLNLARYDLNYDVRDRSRFLRSLTLPVDNQPAGLADLKQHVHDILLDNKLPTVIENDMEPASEYTLGSLSLLANQPLPGYEPLPDYPEEQPDTSVRDVEELDGWAGSRTMVVESGFGSDSFDARYRGDRAPSVALSGVEAFGNAYTSSSTSHATKKKDGNYDLDAFYDDEESSEAESSEAESSEESDESENEETDENEDDASSDGYDDEYDDEDTDDDDEEDQSSEDVAHRPAARR
ncbi:adaptin N terminal region-domain-containing protein [Gongronella butleri]|nr:adaptin N terminal region-domain-containing protein [Gongronella butleri]